MKVILSQMEPGFEQKGAMVNVLVRLKSRLVAEAIHCLLARENEDPNVAVFVGEMPAGQKTDLLILDPKTLNPQSSSQFPVAKIILIDTGLAQEEIIPLLITYKLHGVISIQVDTHLFMKALRLVHEGQIWIDNENLKALVSNVGVISKQDQIEKVSKREQQILDHIVQGRTNKEIAATLFISEQTVKAHMSRIFKKFKVGNRSRLITSILRHGAGTPGSMPIPGGDS